MKKLPVPAFAKNIVESAKKNKSEIVIISSIAGYTLGMISMVPATQRALKDIEEYKEETGIEELTPLETVKVCWKRFIMPISMWVASTAGTAYGTVDMHNEKASLSTALSMSNGLLRDYRDKVVEVIGEKKEGQIRDEVAKERLSRIEVPEEVESDMIYDTRHGHTLFYDPIASKFFWSDREFVSQAEKKMIKRLGSEMKLSINEWYDELDLPHLIKTVGDDLGWMANRDSFGIRIVPLPVDGMPNQSIQMIEYDYPPKYFF